MKNIYYMVLTVFISASVLGGCGESTSSNSSVKGENITPASLPVDKSILPTTSNKKSDKNDVPESLPVDKNILPTTSNKKSDKNDVPESLPVDKSILPKM